MSNEEGLYTLSLFFFICSNCFPGFFIDAAIIETPLTKEDVCVGSNKRLSWTYSNVSQLNVATWTKGASSSLIATKIGTADAIIDAAFSGKVIYISDGIIELLNAADTDSDSYKFSISYLGSSGLPIDDDSTDLTVLVPPVSLTGNCTDSGCKCYVTNLGTPAAVLKIKVNGGNSQTPAEISSLADVEYADCCVEGDVVTCMPENTGGGIEYCVRIYSARPCRLHICYIGVYVAAFSAVVFLVVYFIVRCHFDIGADSLLKIALLSSCCCMVICIIIGVAICIPEEPDCDKGVGIAVPIVIVIILHPLVTVGVIACHIKCCPSLGESSESCLGRNRSILPICSGQDPQNPQNPGQPPQRQAEPQIRHGPGGTQSNQGRPQPQSGDEKHHSSVQKSNPEKSGSTVSGSHVAIDEEPFKPRKLPGIPADSKNARGLSANFDEVLPDKHRLTPLGQEARFDDFEETPKKKKKKKKSSEKDLDTSTDF